jgi:lipopolysaccharide/colanic/teichoic acid biosynthesis glycosyltransferase
VRPGLTGWAQIHGRNAISWPERIALDVWYVRHRSLWLDLRILLRTPSILMRQTGIYGPLGNNLDYN